MDERIGKVFTNNQGYKAVITKKSEKTTRRNKVYWIRFLDSKSIREADIANLKRGSFKDYSQPNVYGVGFTYRGAKKGNERIYSLWHGMMSRCYNKNYDSYPWYGKRGVRVSSEWLHFSKFEDDVRKLKNYEKFLDNPNEYSLDKDMLGTGKLYSKDTCMFATKKQQSENTRSAVKVRIISSDVVVREHPSMAQCARDLKLTKSNVFRALNGKVTATDGYTFERI